ncbi:MAG: hypothetical protein AB1523_09675 [Bacillota bacterium]
MCYLSKEEIEKLKPGYEIDSLIAEILNEPLREYRYARCRYSQNMLDAGKVIESTLWDPELMITKWIEPGNEGYAIVKMTPEGLKVVVIAPALPEAICKGFLLSFFPAPPEEDAFRPEVTD